MSLRRNIALRTKRLLANFICVTAIISSFLVCFWFYHNNYKNNAKAAPPSATSVSPNSGSTAGGTSTTITGTNFDIAGFKWGKSIVASGTAQGIKMILDSVGNTYILAKYSGTIVVGTITLKSINGLGDFLLIKYDASGNLIWSKSDGASNDDKPGDIAIDSNGNIYVVGAFYGTGTFGNTTLTSTLVNVITLKYNSNGDILWAKKGGSTNPFVDDEGRSISLDASGNVYIIANARSNYTFDQFTQNLTNGDSYIGLILVKYSNTGTILMAKSYIPTNSSSNTIEGNGIVVGDSNSIYISGFFKGTVTIGTNILTSSGSSGAEDVLVAKFDSNFINTWVKRGGAEGTDRAISINFIGTSVIVTGYFFTAPSPATFGSFSLSSSGGNDIFVSKYDSSSGNELYVQKAGGTGDDKANKITQDTSGNFYITGYFNGTATFGTNSVTSSGGNDIFVSKYDSSGNNQWVQRAGGTSADIGNGIAVDNSGNVYVTGSFIGNANFGNVSANGNSTNNAFISKRNSTGNFISVIQLYSYSELYSTSIAMDSANNVYIAGYFNYNIVLGTTTYVSNNSNDIVLIKFNSLGNILWSKVAGGSGDDRPNKIAVDQNNNVYLTGYFNGTATFGTSSITSSGSSDIFVSKYDSSGNNQWVQRAGGTSADIGNGIAVDNIGNVYVTGSFIGNANFGSLSLTNSNSSTDGFLVKYSTLGVSSLAKKFGGTVDDKGNGIKVDLLGNVIVVGRIKGTATFDSLSINTGATTNHAVVIAKYNSNFNITWVKNSSTSTNALLDINDLALDNLNNIYSLGTLATSITFATTSITSTGLGVFVIKYDTNGNLLWLKKGDGPGADYGKGIALDNSNNVYVTGYYTGTGATSSITFDTVSLPLGSANSTDVFIAKFNSSGTVLWGQYAGSTQGNDIGVGLAIDTNSDAYVTGTISNGIANTQAILGQDIISPATTDSFISKTSQIKITFGGQNVANINSITATSISLSTPPHAIGPVDIIITNPDGSSFTLTSGYTYIAPLVIDSPTTVSFTTSSVSVNAQTVTANLNSVCIDDNRLDGSGWSANISITNFVGRNDTSKIIPLASSTDLSNIDTIKRLRILPSTVSTITGNATATNYNTIANLTSLSSLDNTGVSNSFIMVSLNSNNAASAKHCVNATIFLDIPAYTYAQPYDAVITVSVI